MRTFADLYFWRNIFPCARSHDLDCDEDERVAIFVCAPLVGVLIEVLRVFDF